ncbi:hypothetical protein A2335_02250 [Candidatus Peregrinibacteria bacterium RIFOXYB2_FULL_32_7]|nr:MAG: hypothetical protein A2335_02250 [Candidatus Peregrinibacteria bacterium RIFOXYB2_FULL_32_7]
MSSSLLQVVLEEDFKSQLEQVARYMGISTSSFVRLVLTESVRKKKAELYSENGLILGDELEILQREKELFSDYKNGKIKPLKAKDFLKELNA